MFAPRFTRRSAVPALLAISILVVLAACSPAASVNPSEAAGASPSAGATSEQPSASTAPSATPEPTPGVGVQVLVGDQQYVTVTLAEQWAGTDQLKPAAGNVFITVNIRIDAITTTSFASEDFSLKDGDGNVYNQILGRSPRLSFLDGLEPNHNYAGFVTFEIPADMTADLTLVYAPSFLTTTYEIPLTLS
jgi:hypothetical protein